MNEETPVRRRQPKKVQVKLIKNYRPEGDFEIVDAAPPPRSGVGSGERVWAGSTIKLTKDEAVAVLESKIAERADALTAD